MRIRTRGEIQVGVFTDFKSFAHIKKSAQIARILRGAGKGGRLEYPSLVLWRVTCCSPSAHVAAQCLSCFPRDCLRLRRENARDALE